MLKKQTIKQLLVLLLIITFSYTFANAKEKKEAKTLLHFIQISDIHLQKDSAKDAERLLGSSEKLLSKCVSQINEIPDIDFILASGDVVDTPKEETIDKFIDITMLLNKPLYVLLGNHDVSVGGGLKKTGFIKKFTDLEKATSFQDSMPYYSFSPNEHFTIICLDGTTDKVVTGLGQFDDEQLNWLKNELETNKNKYVIIAQHYPIVEPFKSKTHYILEPDKTKLSNIIDSYPNVIGVFSGHYHAAKLVAIKNKIHNSCPPVIQYPNAFREIIVTQESPNYLNVQFKWHVIDEPELREKSMSSSKAWVLSQGSPKDQEQTFKLKISHKE